jgi:hypothetical protein
MIKSFAFHTSKIYVYRQGLSLGYLVDAKLACVTGKARKVIDHK